MIRLFIHGHLGDFFKKVSRLPTPCNWNRVRGKRTVMVKKRKNGEYMSVIFFRMCGGGRFLSHLQWKHLVSLFPCNIFLYSFSLFLFSLSISNFFFWISELLLCPFWHTRFSAVVVVVVVFTTSILFLFRSTFLMSILVVEFMYTNTISTYSSHTHYRLLWNIWPHFPS